ncbi:MAG TPA: ATP-binding protein [Kofleriaceae bacterium]|nr:ATP-binding protein [Kofleriaceae bacterium]
MSRAAERYKLIERIGAGGLGVVHRALDRATGQEVAMKIMPRPRGGTNLRDEFVALARLRHKNIVAVLDYGLTDAGHEYFTMELVMGPQLAQAAPRGSPALFALMDGVLDALAFVHARGMVHADIKPTNLLVDGAQLGKDASAAVRLADFGLAMPNPEGRPHRAKEQSEPSLPAVRGTIAYAAPEAWAGQIDARSDLYSLGIVLYELATGQRPFAGTSAREVLSAQRRSAPRDPREITPELSPAFAELVVSLCDPAPGARPQSADEVRDRLGAIGGRAIARSDDRPSQPLWTGGPLVGRDRELADLERAWRDAKNARGSVALVLGEEGMGASRLSAELAIRIQLDRGTVLRATLGSGPWGGLDSIVRALLALAGQRADTAEAAARKAALAPILAGRGDIGGEARWATAEAVTQLALAAAQERPIAILVDDSQLASSGAADVLAYLARAAPDAAILVVLAGRRGPSISTGPMDTTARLANAVKGAARALRIDLPPLDRQGLADLITAAVGRELADRLADELHRACGGNPGHALRALELIARDRQIRRVRGAWIADGNLTVPLPPDALESARARMHGLPAASRAVLRAAAAIGDAFDRDLMAAALGVATAVPEPTVPEDDATPIPIHDERGSGARFDDVSSSQIAVPVAVDDVVSISVSVRVAVPTASTGDDSDALSRKVGAMRSIEAIDAALADAVAARVLTADPAAGAFRFAHPELARALADELAVDDRKNVQKRAAEALEQRRAGGRPVPAAMLARLYVALGNPIAALAWARAAADAAADAGDPESALAFASEALLYARGVEAAQLTERIGDLATRTGDVDLALRHYQLVLGSQDADAETRVRVAMQIAELQRRRGQSDGAFAVLMQALSTARSQRLARAEANLHRRIGWVLMYKSDYKAATEHAIAGLVLARSSGDRKAAAELGQLAAAVAIYQGDTRRALDVLDEALADADQIGDPRLRAKILHEVGRAAIHAGDYVRASSALEAAIAAAASAGDVEQRAKSLNNYGAASYYRGDWPRARRAWEQFRQLCERMGDHAEMLFALNNLGSLYRELGMLAEAREVLERASDVAAQTGQAHVAAMVLANRGEVEMKDGDLAGARERYERALGEFSRLGAKADVIETKRRLCELDLVVGRVDEALSRAIDTMRDAKDGGVKLEEAVLHRVAATSLRLGGDLDSAKWFLDRAREMLAPLDARYELGKCAAEAAEQARALSDEETARTELDLAEKIFGELGARWDLDRARARRAPRTSASPSGAGVPVIAEILRDVGGADVERLLAMALDKILAASGYERGFVLLLDTDGRPREHLRRTRPGARTFDRGDAEFSGTIVRRVAASGQAAEVGDASLDADLRDQRSVVTLGLRRIMCAPLRVGGRVIGIVYVDSSQVAGDDETLDLAALEAIAAPLALAIENARLVVDGKRKSELMSILAHEIRNPLAGILGYSEMGSDPEIQPDADYRELLGRIRHDAERLRRLVDNVLELARHESDNVDWSMGAVDLGALAADVAQNYRPVCERKRVHLVVQADEAAGVALGNPDRLAQVLSNLIGNAVKFTPVDGTITVRVRREAVRVKDPNAPPIPATEVRAWVPGGDDDVVGEFLRVDVADTGPGMTPELRAHLFEKFSQGAGSKRTSGIGLGLYISREIVRRHSGTIWVDSELGKGATFSFRLPVAL